MRPIDADALISEIKKDTEKAIEQDDKVGSFWLGYIAGLVIKQPTIQSALDSETIIRTIETGITATNSNDVYSLGMRNGMRWCKSLIDGVEPKFEEMSVDNGKELPTIQPEKTQLSCEGTTSDTISRQWLLECVDEGWIKFDTEKDANRFIHLVRDIAPTAQPVVTDTNVGDTISRQAALEKVRAMQTYKLFMGDDMILVDKAEVQTELMMMPPAEPEPTNEQVEEYCKRRCLHVVTADFFESTKPQRLGHWVDGLCDECGGQAPFWVMASTYYESDFCPHCGAKMKGAEHEND